MCWFACCLYNDVVLISVLLQFYKNTDMVKDWLVNRGALSSLETYLCIGEVEIKTKRLNKIHKGDFIKVVLFMLPINSCTYNVWPTLANICNVINKHIQDRFPEPNHVVVLPLRPCFLTDLYNSFGYMWISLSTCFALNGLEKVQIENVLVCEE